MTQLSMWSESGSAEPLLSSDDIATIAEMLSNVGVRFERWPITSSLPANADQTIVLRAFTKEIDRLNREGGYRTADVVRLAKGTQGTAPMRAKFLDEHTHSEDEVRFFVEGSGAFYLHIAQRVYMVVCTAGDLISVPANTCHWFDMGEYPHFTAIRLFTAPEGWVAQYTGDKIAGRFPLHTTNP